MIEEAAGTRMYESKKQQAIKTMEKKQSKLGEIENVIIWTCLEFVPTKFSKIKSGSQMFYFFSLDAKVIPAIVSNL